jgi:metallo-beta-lactamase family protein
LKQDLAEIDYRLLYRSKGLLNWLSELENKPKKVFLVHGCENQPADELRIKIRNIMDLIVLLPLMGQEFEI